MATNYTLTSPIDIKSSSVNPSQLNLFPGSASTFSVQLQAPTSLATNIPFILPSINGTPGQYLQYGVGGATSWKPASNSTSTLPISFRFSTTTGAPTTTTSTTFIALGRFYYGGTNTDNPIATAIATVRGSNTVATGQIQLFNLTNATTIATSATFGPTSGTTISVNLGTISNLPANPAILEIRFRRVNVGGGGVAGTADIYAFQLLG
jgi:hypothetical protein